MSNIQGKIRSMYKMEYKVFTRSKHHISSWLSKVNHALNIQQFVFMLSEMLCPTSYFQGDKLLQAHESLFTIQVAQESSCKKIRGLTRKKICGLTFRDVKRRNKYVDNICFPRSNNIDTYQFGTSSMESYRESSTIFMNENLLEILKILHSDVDGKICQTSEFIH